MVAIAGVLDWVPDAYDFFVIRELVDSTGYNDPIEVEIFNEAVWRHA